MLLDYWPIAVLIIFTTLIGIIAIGLGYIFGPKRPSAVKAEPYESGMRPIGAGTRRMPVRFLRGIGTRSYWISHSRTPGRAQWPHHIFFPGT